MNQPIRVFIVEEHRLLREAMATLLGQQEGIMFVGSTADPDEAVARARSRTIDVLLLDAGMGSDEVAEVTREIKEELPDLKTIVLGLEADEEDVLEFIEAGASGYVLKEASFAELLRTIEAVYHGQTPCSPRMAALVSARIAELARERDRWVVQHHVTLTLREKQILQFVAADLSNKEIAQRLGVTLHTVKNHVHNILEKLQVHRRQEALRCAYDNGMLKGAWRSRLFTDPDRGLDTQAQPGLTGNESSAQGPKKESAFRKKAATR